MSTATVEPGHEGAADNDLLGRLEALAAQVHAQSALIEQLQAQSARIARQDERIAAQDAVIARLTSAPASVAVQTVANIAPPKLKRRSLLTKALAATAAAAVLTVAKEPQRADAAVAATVLYSSTDYYGLAAIPIS